ncbi:MAG: hypothetical protein JO141_21205 [Bradyrhizobium sp.]|nr:hypothetical protein [Bradyrhizobium sp.]
MQRLYPSKGTGYLAGLINQRLKIFHPYGTVGQLEWQGGGRSIHFGAADDTYDLAVLSGGIRTYNEEVEDQDKVKELRSLISTASRIVFLGFHFHRQNIELIAPESTAPNLSGNIEMLATHVDRSKEDRNFIFHNRLRRVMHGRSVPAPERVLEACDCVQLFKNYGILFAG